MTILHRRSDVIWDRVDGVMTLCHLGTGEFSRLNETGAMLWEACDASTIEELVAFLMVRYPDERKERLAEAVAVFVASLEETELIELRGPTPYPGEG